MANEKERRPSFFQSAAGQVTLLIATMTAMLIFAWNSAAGRWSARPPLATTHWTKGARYDRAREFYIALGPFALQRSIAALTHAVRAG